MVLNDKSLESSMGISFPGKRVELIHLLNELSDKIAQENLWVKHRDYPNNSGIDAVIHFFFNDTDIAQDAYSEIGSILKNSLEADRLQELSLGLDKMLDRLGNVDSETFMRDAEWASIVKLAANALTEMCDLRGKAEGAK